jgi:alcohol dehydrogenase class IV
MMWFFRSPEIVFGEGALDHLADLEGQRAFIVTDENIAHLGFVELVQNRLREAGIESSLFAEVEPDPCLQTVQRAGLQAAAYEPDWIVGLGGGSCLDAAKAVWFLYERPELDLEGISPFEDFGLGAKARLIAIPTTSGTGSEATIAAILTDLDECRKMALGSAELLPTLSIVDPLFTRDLPPEITANTGIDALTHAIEGYTTSWHNDFSDGLCLKAIQLVFEYLPRAYELGARDPEARERMHNAATIAGLGFGNAMAALAHALGHALGAAFHVPHGRTVGLFLPYTIEFTARSGESRYADIARLLGLPAQDEVEGAASLVAAIRDLYRRIHFPLSLAELGIAMEELQAEMAQLIDNTETDTQIVSSLRVPESDQIEKLLLHAFEGHPIDF